jgi:hypothetical protein
MLEHHGALGTLCLQRTKQPGSLANLTYTIQPPGFTRDTQFLGNFSVTDDKLQSLNESIFVEVL